MSANSFNINEIFDFAIMLEERGMTFYTQAAKRAKTNKQRELFTFLSEQESNHKDRFKALLEQLKNYDPESAYPIEYYQYLSEYANSTLFKSNEAVHTLQDISSIINYAIGVELYSVLYYTELHKLIDKKSSNDLEKIIEEEKNHYLLLVQLKKENE